MRENKFILCILVCCISLASCDLKWYSPGRQACEKAIVIDRFDILLRDYVETGNFSFLQRMKTDHPAETNILIENVLKIGGATDAAVGKKLRAYYKDPTLAKLLKDVDKKFRDMSKYEKQLNRAFCLLRQECPQVRIPRVYTLVSALNQSIVVSDTLVGISLDKYLGGDYPLYRKYYLDYQRHTMRPSRMIPDCLYFYLNSELPEPEEAEKRTLLYEMIKAGKINWIISKITDASINRILGLTSKSEQWWDQNGLRIWNEMSKENGKLLLSTDSSFVHSTMTIAPNVASETKQQFDGCGVIMGTYIINSYMTKNPDTTISDLLNLNDCSFLLKESGY